MLILAKMFNQLKTKTILPSGLRRWPKAPFRKSVGSNHTAVISPSISIRKLAVLERLIVHVSSKVMKDLLLDMDIDVQIILLGFQAGYSSVGRASDCRILQQSDGP